MCPLCQANDSSLALDKTSASRAVLAYGLGIRVVREVFKPFEHAKYAGASSSITAVDISATKLDL